MKWFEGIDCCLTAIEEVLARQLKEDHCLCASCYLGYKELYRTTIRNKRKYGLNWITDKRKAYHSFELYWEDVTAWKKQK